MQELHIQYVTTDALCCQPSWAIKLHEQIVILLLGTDALSMVGLAPDKQQVHHAQWVTPITLSHKQEVMLLAL